MPFSFSRFKTVIDVETLIAHQRAADAVYVTSGKGTRRLARDAGFLAALAIDPARQIVAAVDSGALVLAAKGLLTGKRATTYPSPDLHDALAGLAAFAPGEIDRDITVLALPLRDGAGLIALAAFLGGLAAGEGQPVAVGVDQHHVAVGELAGEQAPGQLVADRLGDQPPQRPGQARRCRSRR